MKTLLTFALGLSFGLYGAHYYDTSKTEYFDSLYTLYLQQNSNQLTAKQFEKQWQSNLPWCFSTSSQNICNSATACSTGPSENNLVNTTIPSNQLVEFHSKMIEWYPVAKHSVVSTYGEIEIFIQKQLES